MLLIPSKKILAFQLLVKAVYTYISFCTFILLTSGVPSANISNKKITNIHTGNFYFMGSFLSLVALVATNGLQAFTADAYPVSVVGAGTLYNPE